jgi:dTDP-glucose 4,6-dehydratase
VHFAAESHVDRSIHGPAPSCDTTWSARFELLEAARAYWQSLEGDAKAAFRFLHVSTDEVYGTLARTIPRSARPRPTRPTAPIGVEGGLRPPGARLPPHLRLPDAHHQLLEQLRAVQFPEKLIPLMIANALEGKPLPVYGDGRRCATGST